MIKSNLRDLTVEQLVNCFAEIGVEQAKAILYDQSKKYNRLLLEMNAVDDELRRRGPSARLQLLSLYDHPNVQVQLQAAEYTAPVAPAAARTKVEAIKNSREYPQAAEAGMALSSWDEYGISDR